MEATASAADGAALEEQVCRCPQSFGPVSEVQESEKGNGAYKRLQHQSLALEEVRLGQALADRQFGGIWQLAQCNNLAQPQPQPPAWHFKGF